MNEDDDRMDTSFSPLPTERSYTTPYTNTNMTNTGLGDGNAGSMFNGEGLGMAKYPKHPSDLGSLNRKLDTMNLQQQSTTAAMDMNGNTNNNTNTSAKLEVDLVGLWVTRQTRQRIDNLKSSRQQKAMHTIKAMKLSSKEPVEETNNGVTTRASLKDHRSNVQQPKPSRPRRVLPRNEQNTQDSGFFQYHQHSEAIVAEDPGLTAQHHHQHHHHMSQPSPPQPSEEDLAIAQAKLHAKAQEEKQTRVAAEERQKLEAEAKARAEAEAEADRQYRAELRRRRESYNVKTRYQERIKELSEREEAETRERNQRESLQASISKSIASRARGKNHTALVREFCPDMTSEVSKLRLSASFNRTSIPQRTDIVAITKLVRRAMSRFHPDKLVQVTDVRERLEKEEIFRVLLCAYEELESRR